MEPLDEGGSEKLEQLHGRGRLALKVGKPFERRVESDQHAVDDVVQTGNLVVETCVCCCERGHECSCDARVEWFCVFVLVLVLVFVRVVYYCVRTYDSSSGCHFRFCIGQTDSDAGKRLPSVRFANGHNKTLVSYPVVRFWVPA